MLVRNLKTLLTALTLSAGLILFLATAGRGAQASPLENSCIQCHQGLPDERLARPVALWKKTIHAEVGNTCEGCHGGDPQDATLKAMAPENQFQGIPSADAIPKTCGKCHAALLDFYQDSPHGMMGTPHCTTCHGSHAIRRFAPDIMTEEACAECHAFTYPQQIRIRLQTIRSDLSGLDKGRQTISGFPTSTLDKPLKQARGQFQQARMAIHTFDKSRIDKAMDKVTGPLETGRQALHNLKGLQIKRERIGWGSMLLFGLLAALTFFWNREN
ncbi:MAG: hypothetical protein ACE5ER_11850 [Nitrospinaceae bacterium]